MTAPTTPNTAAGRAAAPVSAAALVDRERDRLRALVAGGGVALAVALAALLLALGAAVLADARWIALPRALPVLLWAAAAAASVGALALSAGLARRRATRSAVAAAIEQERKLRAGALRGALEVGDSGALGRRALDQLGARLAAEGGRAGALAPALQRRAGRLAGALAVVALAALGILAAATTGFADGWRAVEHPIRAWRGTLLPALAVDAPREVLRGERFTVRVSAPGRREVVVHSRATGAGWTSERHAVRDGKVELPLGPLRANTAFVVSDGRTTSDTALVRATDRPFVGDVALLAVFPAYLGRRPEPVASGEVARLPRGTVLQINGRASTALDRVLLARSGDTVSLRADGQRFDGKLVATTSGTWTWSARGASGAAIADLPPNVELDVVPDSAPRVEILQPQHDSVVGADGSVPLSLTASDDHGLASVALRSWRVTPAGTVVGEATDRLAQAAGPQWSGESAIDLASRGLEPGDALHVVAVATDASPWTQRAESRELVFRLPSLSEQRALARRAADSAAAGATELASAEKALAQKTSEAARSRGDRAAGARGSDRSGDRDASSSESRSGTDAKSVEKSLSYQRAEQAKALSQEQRQLADRVQQLQQSAKSLEKQLKQAGALDSGLQARLAEAQKLLREALTPELAAQLQKLEQSAQSLDGDAARQAMGDLAEQQQRLREQLERSAEMLKRAALEGAMQTLRDEARELAQRQRELADAADGKQPPPANASERGRDDSSADRDARKSGTRDSASGASRDGAGRDSASASDASKSDASKAEGAAGSKQQQGDASKSDASKGGDRSPQTPGQAQAQALAQRSRDLAHDVADLEKRLKAERADAGAERADAAQQHASASADAMQRAARQQAPSRAGAGASAQQQQPQGGADAARQASKEMDQAAKQLADAREQQISDWKQELTKELDQSIQEMLQLARSEQQLADQSQTSSRGDVRGQQSSIQQGVEKTGERLQKAGQKSSLLSSRSQRAVGEARQQVQQVTKETSQPDLSGGQRGAQQSARKGDGEQQQPGGSNTPGASAQEQQAMRDAAEALNRAAASLVRDRERANSAKSASGLPEMMEEMGQLAQQQGALNGQAQALSLGMGGKPGSQGAAGARALGQKQRGLAQSLNQLSDNDESGRADALAKEAAQIAKALEQGSLDRSVLDRQQRLYHRLLEAGRTLQQDEREDTGKRESRSGTGTDPFNPGTDKASGKAAIRYREPTWNELRGLSPEERRAVLEYFKRLNAQP